jgi:hypothetical protein
MVSGSGNAGSVGDRSKVHFRYRRFILTACLTDGYARGLQARLSRPYVHLLFGARQTGKSTLLNGLIPEDSLRFNLADPQERSRHLGHPGEFAQACRSLSASGKEWTSSWNGAAD